MPQNAHLIIPYSRTIALSPVQRITQTPVNLDSEHAHQLTWDDDPLFMLSKVQIETLGSAASLDVLESKPLESGHPNIVLWQVWSEIKKPDGDKLRARKTYELDLRYYERDGIDGGVMKVIIQNKEGQAERAIERGGKFHRKDMPARDAKKEEWDAWVRAKSLRELEMWDRHRIARAETGASLRAARSLLTIRSSYRKTEFEIPFVVYSGTYDIVKAIQLGGVFKEMATKLIGASLGTQLNISPEIVAQLTAGIGEDNEPEHQDLFQATDEEQEELMGFLQGHGIKDQRAADNFTMGLFGFPVSQLTTRHIKLIRQSLDIAAFAKERLGDEEMGKFRDHLRAIISVCFADGSELLTIMEQEWYDKIYTDDDTDDDDTDEEEAYEGYLIGDVVDIPTESEKLT